MENGVYLGIEAILQVCCSIEGRVREARVLEGHLDTVLGIDRGIARVTFLRDMMVVASSFGN